VIDSSQRHPLIFPLSGTGRFVAAYAVGNGLKPFPTKDCLPEWQVKGSQGSRKRDFGDSTCICLPARSHALRGEGRALFEQPGKDDFFSSQLG
jgi:hypothetical protein